MNPLLEIDMMIVQFFKELVRNHLPILVWFKYCLKKHRRLRYIRDHFEQNGIRVLFIVVDPSMWKVDSLYREMLAHPAFHPAILIVPNNDSETVTRRATAERLRAFFHAKGYAYIDGCDAEGELCISHISPEYDILMYPQPYPGVVNPVIDYLANRDCLWFSCHYGFHCVKAKWCCMQPYHRYAWMDFYESEGVAAFAKEVRKYAADNIRVTGLPFADALLTRVPDSPWKPLPGDRKKIIWAPHWTIPSAVSCLGHYSQFAEIAEQMRCLVEETSETIQWAFKSHPFLRNALYQHPDWGVEKTDAYYEWWQNGETTQLADGDYIPLFQHSDAMVHDSSSFTCEYLLMGKPACFVTRDPAAREKDVHEQDIAAFRAHYRAADIGDIRRFVEGVVLGGADPKYEERESFAKKHVLTPMGLGDRSYGELFPANAPCNAASRNIICEMLRAVTGRGVNQAEIP